MNRSNQTGNIVFSANEENDIGDLMQEILQTETGKRFVRDYLTREQIDSYTEKIVAAIQENAKNPAEVEVEEAAKILDTMMEAGEFTPKVLPPELPVEQPPTPVVEVDKNNRPLSSSQLQWRDYRIWTDEHGTEECRQRARNDVGYGNYWRKTAEQQFAATAPGDAVTPVGEPDKRTKAGVALATFAQQYLRASTASLRPVNGLVHLGDEAVPVDVFNSLLVRARQAGLI